MAQDLGQLGQQTKEKIGRVVGQFMDCNQTGNQSGGVLGQLGEHAKSMLPPRKIVSFRLLLHLKQ